MKKNLSTQINDALDDYKKSVASKGGQAVKAKYGNDYFKRIRAIGIAKNSQKKDLSTDINE